jgi:TolB-like protein/DNA-binding winged helix-turn-helix (wHTH) protein/Tfp pilus assembly protein PilF
MMTAKNRYYRFENVEIDVQNLRVTVGSEIRPLEPKSFRLLLFLVENPGRILPKDEIVSAVWPDIAVSDNSLTRAITQVRKALDDDPKAQRYIETVPTVGYRFIGDCQEQPSPAGAPDATDSSPANVSPSVSAAARDRAGPNRRAAIAGAAAVVAGLAVGGLVAGLSYKSAGRGETINSLAVLPFVNASSDPNAEYLSDGISESLIDSLSQMPNLKVMSRESAFRYKGKETDARTVGRELGVRAVFEGRVSQRDGNLAISAELIDARDNSHIWGQQYNRRTSDIFVLQEEIAKEITTTLRLRLTGDDEKRLAKRYTENAEAYELYLKGRYWWNKRTDEGFKKGIDQFQQAIEKDPTYALAYAGLADCYSFEATYGFVPPKEAYPKAKEAALRALEIDDQLANVHTSLAWINTEYDWDRSGAEREFRRAIELNPTDADAHRLYGEALRSLGRFDEAVAEFKRAVALDPTSLLNNRSLGAAYHSARRYDEAIEQYRKTLEMDPNFRLVRANLGSAYLQKGMYNEGIAEFEKAGAVSRLGYAYAVAGRRAAAQKVLDQVIETSKQKYVPTERIALIYTGLGEKDNAFEWLEKGYEERAIGGPPVGIKVEPEFDPLRSDPRFQDLLRRMNLQP